MDAVPKHTVEQIIKIACDQMNGMRDIIGAQEEQLEKYSAAVQEYAAQNAEKTELLKVASENAKKDINPEYIKEATAALTALGLIDPKNEKAASEDWIANPEEFVKASTEALLSFIPADGDGGSADSSVVFNKQSSEINPGAKMVQESIRRWRESQ